MFLSIAPNKDTASLQETGCFMVLSVSLIICPDGLFIVARVLLQELDILVGELLLDTADPHGRDAELWPNIWLAEL